MIRNESFKNLYGIAEVQHGLFTTKQAKKAGYAENTHSYHVQTGHWIRRHRGVYQLAHFPTNQEADLVLWSLWSRNRAEHPQGVYSHESALSLHELSDVNPSKFHLTVPKAFRRMAQIPKILRLHFKDLPKGTIENRQGYALTKPLNTILTLLEEQSVSMDILAQALVEGLERGLVIRSDIKKLKLEPTLEKKWQDLLKKASS